MLAVPAALRASLGKSLATFTTMPGEFAAAHIAARGFEPPVGAGRDPSITPYTINNARRVPGLNLPHDILRPRVLSQLPSFRGGYHVYGPIPRCRAPAQPPAQDPVR